MKQPLLRKVDAVTVRVPDLDAGLAFYRDVLGQPLLWRNDAVGQAAVGLPEGGAEIVLTTHHGYEPNWLVDSADEAAAAIEAAGGRILAPAFDIPVGRVAVVADPFDNALVLIDLSTGTYRTESDGNVVAVQRADHWTTDLRRRLEELLDQYRAALHDSLDGLTEDEARLRLTPSKTTLLGLLKHVTYVEGVWFEQAISGQTPAQIGIPTSPDRSFTLTAADTISSVRQAHLIRCETSRRTVAELALDAEVDGRGARPVWALHVQVLRELAQHAGHADILREQILARRPQ